MSVVSSANTEKHLAEFTSFTILSNNKSPQDEIISFWIFELVYLYRPSDSKKSLKLSISLALYLRLARKLPSLMYGADSTKTK